jgi:hypothetical protein
MPFPLDAPAAPLVPTNGFATPDRHGFLDNRSGNRGVAAGDTGSPVLRASSIAPAETLPPGRYLGRRIVDQSPAAVSDESMPADRQGLFGNRFIGDTLPDPDPRAPAAGPLLGVFSGKPMSPTPLPLSVWGLPDNSDASGGDDWFKFLSGITSLRPR